MANFMTDKARALLATGSVVIDYFCQKAGEIAASKGFTEATPAEDIALMHSELSEALEDIRAGVDLDKVWYEVKVPAYAEKGEPVTENDGSQQYVTLKYDQQAADGSRKPCGVPSELADVMVRIFHFCWKHRVDLAFALAVKMAYNEQRPYKHGGKTL